MTVAVKPPRMRAPARALAFAASLPHLQAVAREHGYALAVHGSMATDLDLIAAPWVEEASPPETLIEALCRAVGGRLRVEYDPCPTLKPHGRIAWSIYVDIYEDVYLDVSVMPRAHCLTLDTWKPANGEVQG